MHPYDPDQATEVIADFALAHGKPFALVPCCVFPQLHPGRTLPGSGEGAGEPVTERRQLVRYLAHKLGDAAVDFLEFEGANQVVWSATPPPIASGSAAGCGEVVGRG